MKKFSRCFPDLAFEEHTRCWQMVSMSLRGGIGGGTHTATAFSDWPVGSLPAATGRKMHFTGTTVFKVVDGKVH